MSPTSILAAFFIIFALNTGLAAAQSEDGSARVVVPEVPGGALVAGCYRADRGLYGPYTLTFCLRKKANYSVKGAGLECKGSLAWETRGRDVKITLNRGKCNGNRAWAEASITCRPRSLLDLILSDLLDKRKNDTGRVLVPAPAQVRALRCLYSPTVEGNKPATFVAKRLPAN